MCCLIIDSHKFLLLFDCLRFKATANATRLRKGRQANLARIQAANRLKKIEELRNRQFLSNEDAIQASIAVIELFKNPTDEKPADDDPVVQPTGDDPTGDDPAEQTAGHDDSETDWELMWTKWSTMDKDQKKHIATIYGFETVGSFEDHLNMKMAISQSSDDSDSESKKQPTRPTDPPKASDTQPETTDPPTSPQLPKRYLRAEVNMRITTEAKLLATETGREAQDHHTEIWEDVLAFEEQGKSVVEAANIALGTIQDQREAANDEA